MELGRFNITLGGKTLLDGWRGIGKSQNLQTDAEIAKYLVALYSKQHQDREQLGQTGGRCIHCHTPLTLYCMTCRLPSQAPPSQLIPPQQGSHLSQQAPPRRGSDHSQQVPLRQDSCPQQAPLRRDSCPSQQAPPQGCSHPSQQTPTLQGSSAQSTPFPQGSSSQQAAPVVATGDADSEEGDELAVDVDSDSAEAPESRPDSRESGTTQTHCSLDGKTRAKSLSVANRKADAPRMAYMQISVSTPSERKRRAKETFCNASGELCKPELGLKESQTDASCVKKRRVGKPVEQVTLHQESNSVQLETLNFPQCARRQGRRSAKALRTKAGREVDRASEAQPRDSARTCTQTTSKITRAKMKAKSVQRNGENESVTMRGSDNVSGNTRQANSPCQADKLAPTHKDCRGSARKDESSPKSKGRPRSKLVSGKYLGALKKSNGQVKFFSCFECAHCHEVFNRKSSFNKHVSTHYHGKPHICIKCGDGFQNVTDLKKHKRATHSKSNKLPKFMCDECPAEFKTEGRFHLHKRLHKENKLFACKTCGFVAPSKKGLDNHRLTHRKAAWVQCEYCGETKRVNNMQRHILMHRGEKPYECTQCNAAFRTPFDLKDHVKRRHSEVKPFSCEKCGKGFICADNLKHHLLVHSGQKPYKCALCPSSFSRRDYLTKHVRTHTGEKPYKCGECEEAFAYPNSLKLHRKQFHGGGGGADNCESKMKGEESGLAGRREDGGLAVHHLCNASGAEGPGFGFLPAGVWLPTFSAPELH